MKLLPYILFEEYIYILAPKMASPGNRHCANCIGTSLSFPVAFINATALESVDSISCSTVSFLGGLGPRIVDVLREIPFIFSSAVECTDSTLLRRPSR